MIPGKLLTLGKLVSELKLSFEIFLDNSELFLRNLLDKNLLGEQLAFLSRLMEPMVCKVLDVCIGRTPSSWTSSSLLAGRANICFCEPSRRGFLMALFSRIIGLAAYAGFPGCCILSLSSSSLKDWPSRALSGGARILIFCSN